MLPGNLVVQRKCWELVDLEEKEMPSRKAVKKSAATRKAAVKKPAIKRAAPKKPALRPAAVKKQAVKRKVAATKSTVTETLVKKAKKATAALKRRVGHDIDELFKFLGKGKGKTGGYPGPRKKG